MNPPLLEWSAVAFSILGVWLMAQRRTLAWPVGLISVGLYAAVFFEAKLYSDMLLQGAFAAFLLYGWVNWHRQEKPDGRVVIAPLSPRHCVRDLGLGVAFGLALGAAMHSWTDAALPWLDAMLQACADALPFAVAGDDERYQGEVMRLAPAPKFSPRQAAKGE